MKEYIDPFTGSKNKQAKNLGTLHFSFCNAPLIQ